MHDDQSVRALDPAQGITYRIGEISFVGILDEVSEHFRVGLGLEGVSAGDELVAQLTEVLDDAVVDDRDTACAIAEGMGVEIARPTVRGPASVAQPDARTGRPAAERIRQDRHLAGPLLDEEIAVPGDQGDAGGVVAPILEAAQPVQQDWAGLSGPGVSDDSAHAALLPVSSTTAPGEGG